MGQAATSMKTIHLLNSAAGMDEDNIPFLQLQELVMLRQKAARLAIERGGDSLEAANMVNYVNAQIRALLACDSLD